MKGLEKIEHITFNIVPYKPIDYFSRNSRKGLFPPFFSGGMDNTEKDKEMAKSGSCSGNKKHFIWLVLNKRTKDVIKC